MQRGTWYGIDAEIRQVPDACSRTRSYGHLLLPLVCDVYMRARSCGR